MSFHEGSKWQEEQERKEKIKKERPKQKYCWCIMNDHDEVLERYDKKEEAKTNADNMRRDAERMKVDFFCYVERVVA